CHEHVGAWAAVEQEITLAIGLQGNEGKTGACLPGKAQRGDVHPGLPQLPGQEAPEIVIANHAHEGAADAQPCDSGGDIGWGTARSFLEDLGRDQALRAGGGDEVDEQFTESNDLGHWAHSRYVASGAITARAWRSADWNSS